jgi:hypothetical protein
MEGPGSFFMGMAKLFFYIGAGLGCLSLALYCLAWFLRWLVVMMNPSAGSQGRPASPDATPQGAVEGDQPAAH